MPREPKSRAPSAPVGIKDIARQLGVSTGTVDRALNSKPDVSPATRARVLDLAEKLGYKPNLAARFLQSSKQLRISVHLPRRIALFWDALRDGIREAAAPFGPALHVDVRTYPCLGEGDIPLLEEALADGTDGLIIAPGNPSALAPYLREAARRNIPVVCVVTDAPDSPRLELRLRRSVHGRRDRRRAARPVRARRRPGRVLHRLAGDAGSRRQAARLRVEPVAPAARGSRSVRSSRRTTTNARPIGAPAKCCGPTRPSRGSTSAR